jgi:transmembrane sensor
VSVYSGFLQLQPLQGPVLSLRGGQQVDLQAGGAGSTTAFDVLAPGWREGVLMAKNRPLGDFLRELSSYRPGVLRWEPALEALRVTGSFRLDDTDRVLTLLAASLPLEVHSRTRYWVTLLPRKNSV